MSFCLYRSFIYLIDQSIESLILSFSLKISTFFKRLIFRKIL